MAMQQRIALKAVIVNDGRVLILREADTYDEGTQNGKYHMPGGRLEVGEPFQEGLAREVFKETGLKVDVEYPIYVGEWRPVIKGVPIQIVGVFFVCKPKSKKVVLSDEHDDYKWIDPSERKKYQIMDPEDKVLDRFYEWTTK